MSRYVHKAIVVTSWHEEGIGAAREVAIGHGLPVSSIVGPVLNGFRSFLVAPDGCKEGWPDAENSDAARSIFIAWLKAQTDVDGSSRFAWVAVQFDDNLYSRARNP